MAKRRKKLEELTLADNFLFMVVMSNTDIAKRFLEALFSVKIKSIKKHVIQDVVEPAYDSRGVRFDVEFEGDDTIYDIEMQQKSARDVRPADIRELLRRTRYYQSSLDARYLKPGSDFKQLPESKIVFICTFDPFNVDYAKYTQKPTIGELNKFIDSGTEVIYLNTEFVEEMSLAQPILDLLRYIKNPAVVTEGVLDPFVQDVDDLVAEAKISQDVRRDYMSLEEYVGRAVEDALEEEREESINRLSKRLGICKQKAEELL